MTIVQIVLGAAAVLQFAVLTVLMVSAVFEVSVHLAMPPGCEAVARSFYHDLLEIPEVMMPPKAVRRGGCWFEGFDGMTIHLGPTADFRPTRRAYLGVSVSGFEELCGRLRAHGYEVLLQPRRRGSACALVEDPFGNRIKIRDAGY